MKCFTQAAPLNWKIYGGSFDIMCGTGNKEKHCA